MNPPSPLSMRGLMIDAARWPESPDHVRRFIDLAADWQINAILFRLTDDSGSAMKFNGHPELITHPDAWTPEQAHELALYAQQRGIELIPEIESLGHAKYILNVPAYAYLADSPLNENDIYSFNGLCMVHPDTLKLMSELYEETARIFPGRYLHGGCDEVKWGQGELSKQALATKPAHEILADYLNQLTRLAHDQGRRLIVWADHVMHAPPEILSRLDQRLILHDWNYEFDSAPTVALRLDRITQAGLSAIGGPAMGWCRWGARVGSQQLANVDAYVKAYRDAAESGNEKSLGIISTHWVPGRYFANGVWDHFHYAAHRITHGLAQSPRQIGNLFSQEHWGVQPDPTWESFFAELHEAIPPKAECGPRNGTFWLPVYWYHDQSLQALLHQAMLNCPTCPHQEHDGDGRPKATQDWSLAEPQCQRINCLIESWQQLSERIKRNHRDWQALGASLRWLLWQIERSRQVIRLGDAPTSEEIARTFTAIAQGDQELLPLMTEHFGDTRQPRLPLQWPESCNGWEFPHVLLPLAEAFARQIAQQPERLTRIRSQAAIPLAVTTG